jgi:hypothetical protein
MSDEPYIFSDKRIPVPTPADICDAAGNPHFGTFDREFERLSFLDIKKPCGEGFPDSRWAKRLRLTLWEAVEVHVDGGVLLLGVCNMGLVGTVVAAFYDEETKKVTSWSVNTPGKDVVIAPHLAGGSVTECNVRRCKVKYVNHFERGRVTIEGRLTHRTTGTIEFDLELDNLSDPSVVSIPLSPGSHPLYSQKNFFKVSRGSLVMNGRSYAVDDDSVAIIDDHRGYYPRRSHYDWVTTLGRRLNGEEAYFAFNLTRNQSTNQDDYNENIVWVEGGSSLLPPVTFSRDYYGGDGTWGNRRTVSRVPDASVCRVRDAHGLVDLTFHARDTMHIVVPAVVVDIDYHIMFGDLSGYITDAAGKRYELDGLTGIGEDKSLLL